MCLLQTERGPNRSPSPSEPVRPVQKPVHTPAGALDLPTEAIIQESDGINTTSEVFTLDQQTRSGRVRRARDFAILSECTCGATVSEEEIAAKEAVIECRKRGCETRWVCLVHLILLTVTDIRVCCSVSTIFIVSGKIL